MYGLLILNLIVPFVMILVGYSFKKHPVTDMNSGNGYNTPTSRKSQEHWDYAQSIAPDIFIDLGKISGVVELVLSILFLILRLNAYFCVVTGTIVGVIFLILAFCRTEITIKSKF
jgi:hypothetical protein